MRTTINLDDHLLAGLKQMAAKTGRTMTSIIEDAIRQAIRPEKPASRKKVRLTVVAGKGPRPGVDLDDSASLLDLMDRRR
jgi:metal-responsive CopG/Arc/MetJ family transcriptional regulator